MTGLMKVRRCAADEQVDPRERQQWCRLTTYVITGRSGIGVTGVNGTAGRLSAAAIS